MNWIAFHDYIPDKYTWNSNGLYCFNNGIIYKMLSSNYGLYEGVYFPSSTDFIFNSNTAERFLLRHVKWVSNIESGEINYWNETISKLLIYSKNLCTEEITIAKRSYSYNGGTYVMEDTGNAMFKDGEWVFDDIKDYLSTPNSVFLDANYNLLSSALNLSKLYYEKSKFITKFIVMRLIYTNSSSNKKIRISNIGIEAKNIL